MILKGSLIKRSTVLVFVSPWMKLSGLKRTPMRLPLTLSIVPGSRSTSRALGTYLPPTNRVEMYTYIERKRHPELKYIFTMCQSLRTSIHYLSLLILSQVGTGAGAVPPNFKNTFKKKVIKKIRKKISAVNLKNLQYIRKRLRYHVPHWSRHWPSPAGGRSLPHRCLLHWAHVHHWSLPKTRKTQTDTGTH